MRDRNEDATLAGPAVFAVADGMGGHRGGQVAAAMVVAALADLRPAGDADEVVAAVRASCAAAHRGICRRAAEDPDLEGMGATVAGLVRTPEGGFAVFHVGDARVYLLRGRRLEAVTSDHSVVGELIASGALDPRDAAAHPERHIVTRALGAASSAAPDLVVRTTSPGDTWLVASDGLTSEVADPDIAALLATPTSPEARARALVDAALASGGRDNVSVVVVAVDASPTTDGLDATTGPRRSLADGDRRTATGADGLDDVTAPRTERPTLASASTASPRSRRRRAPR